MDAKEKIRRAKEYCQRNNISEGNPDLGNPDLLYLILGEIRSTNLELRSTNFRLAVLLGTNAVLVALILAILLGG